MIENAIRGRLLDSTGVTALIGSSSSARAYHLRLPEGVTLPAVTYQRISRVGFPDYAGDTDLATRRIQVDSWAGTGESAASLGEEIRKSLDGFRGTVATVAIRGAFLVDEAQEYEVETGLHRLRQDFMVSHSEEVA